MITNEDIKKEYPQIDITKSVFCDFALQELIYFKNCLETLFSIYGSLPENRETLNKVELLIKFSIEYDESELAKKDSDSLKQIYFNMSDMLNSTYGFKTLSVANLPIQIHTIRFNISKILKARGIKI